MQPFKMKVTQDLYEIMNCFKSNENTRHRLVGPGEGVFIVMFKDNDIYSMGDASLSEQQAMAMINHISIFTQRLTRHSTRLMKGHMG